MTEQLKPCPFCGSTDISLWTGFGTQAEIECNECGCDRRVQVIDLREDGEPYPEFDSKTCRYPDFLIERVNRHLISEWNTRQAVNSYPEMREGRKTFSEIKKIALTIKRDDLRDGLARIVRLCIDAGAASPARRNWSEDTNHENGNYENLCIECDQSFIGHKRRVLCKACSDLLSPAKPSLPIGK